MDLSLARKSRRASAKWFYVTILLFTASGLWGAKTLLLYQETPGRASGAEKLWPSSSTLQRPLGRAALLLFAHPQCSCTRATLEELAAVLSTCGGVFPETHVLFARLGGEAEWRSTPLWAPAADLPGAHAQWDPDAAEAKLFGVKTSGQVLLYDKQGMLTFAGGITAARGHSGQNRGADALQLALTRSLAQPRRFPVFGCSLFGPSSKGFSND